MIRRSLCPTGTIPSPRRPRTSRGMSAPARSPYNATIETVYQPVIAGVSLTTSPGLSLLGIVLVPSQQSLSVIGTAPPNESVAGLPRWDLAGNGERQRAGELELQLRALLVHGRERDLRLLGGHDGRVGERQRAVAGHSRSRSAVPTPRRRRRPSTPRGSSRARRPRAAWSPSSTAMSSSASWRPTRPASGSSRPRCRRANTPSWWRPPIAAATRACCRAR